MAIGTIQAIEYAKPKVGIDKIDLYAGLFELTAEQVRHPEPTRPPAAWHGLNHEHLAIAHQYAMALMSVRTAVELLLKDEATARELAEMVLALKRIADRDPGALAGMQTLLDLDDLFVRLAKRLEADPTFEQTLRELINARPK